MYDCQDDWLIRGITVRICTRIPLNSTEEACMFYKAGPVFLRENYLKKIRPFCQDTDIIKVLTGVRR